MVDIHIRRNFMPLIYLLINQLFIIDFIGIDVSLPYTVSSGFGGYGLVRK
jgi:hypothetical protein